MVKTIIFDLDGVLVYTDKFHYLAWKKMADRIGVPFDETINNRLRGVSRMDSLEIILERSTRKYTQEEKEDLAEEKNGYYKEFLKKMSPADVRPEIRGMLKELFKGCGIYADHTRELPCGGGCHSGNRCGESRRDACCRSR